MFVISHDYVLPTSINLMIENGFTQKGYFTEIMQMQTTEMIERF